MPPGPHSFQSFAASHSSIESCRKFYVLVNAPRQQHIFLCPAFSCHLVSTLAAHMSLKLNSVLSIISFVELQMLLFPNALCYSLYERNCVCAVTKIFTKFLPTNNFCQLLLVTPKCSCTSAGNAQAQLHFRDDQQSAFGISNISN